MTLKDGSLRLDDEGNASGASQSLLKVYFTCFNLSHQDETPNDVIAVTLKDVIAARIPVSANTVLFQECVLHVPRSFLIFTFCRQRNARAQSRMVILYHFDHKFSQGEVLGNKFSRMSVHRPA